MNHTVGDFLNIFNKFNNTYYKQRYDDFIILMDIAEKYKDRYESRNEDILLFLDKFKNKDQLKRELAYFNDEIDNSDTFNYILSLLHYSLFEFKNFNFYDYNIISRTLNGEDLSEEESFVYYENFKYISDILANLDEYEQLIDFKGEYGVFKDLVEEYKRIQV